MDATRPVDDLRSEANQRSASAGPLVAVAGLLRSYLDVTQKLDALLR
jgi:hypothetical protein